MIEVKGLTKRFGPICAVNHLDLTVARGEIFGFIGPNGAGKTTTIRMMGGIISPTAGSIRIDGIDMQREPQRAKRMIGFIPDRPFLYDKLTGMEFLRFTGDLYSVNGKDLHGRAVQLLRLFSLHEWGDELIESYSHGMKQRLIMAAALLHQPEVIIVDEPMVGLDPRGIKMVKDLFRDLADRGTSIFLSTHTLAVAQDICHRIGVIHKGSLIAMGTTKDLERAAHVEAQDLEAVFLRLTEEGDAR